MNKVYKYYLLPLAALSSLPYFLINIINIHYHCKFKNSNEA